MSNHTYTLQPSYTSGGQFCQNVLHYEFDDAGYTDTNAAALALINAFDTANTTHLKNLCTVHTDILSYRSRGVTMPGGFEAIKLLSGVSGLRTGNLGATAVSPVAVLFPSGNAKPRGRVFLPGVTDLDLIDGEYTSVFRSNFTTHAVMFVNTLTLAGGGTPVATPVLYSRKTTPGSSYTVEYVRLSDMAGTQRRRQRPA
jgi:hypothetical protein